MQDSAWPAVDAHAVGRGTADWTGHRRTTSANAPSGSSPSAWSDPQVPPRTVGANLGHHERELHWCHFPPTMFRKQVSRQWTVWIPHGGRGGGAARVN